MDKGVWVLSVGDGDSAIDPSRLESGSKSLTVETEPTAAEALARLEAETIHCVLVPSDLPETAPLTFIERLRETWPTFPIIFRADAAGTVEADEALTAGATDYIPPDPPIDQHTLLKTRITNAVTTTGNHHDEPESTAYYRTLLEHTADYVMVVDASGHVDYVSPAVERILGYTPTELTQMDAFDTIHPDDYERAATAFEDVLAQPDQEHTVEYRAQAADGEWRWLDVRGRNCLADPLIEGIIVAVRDITERKQHQRFSSATRDINRALVRADSPVEVEQAVCDILSEADPYLTACIAEVNPETMRIEPRTWRGAARGYFENLDMVVAENAPGRHSPGGRAYHDREIAISQNIPQDPNYEKWQPDATDRGFQALAVVPLEYDDELYGLLAVFADRPQAFDESEQQLLSELGDDIAHALHAQQLQAELRATSSRLEALFEQSPDMLNVHDADGNIIDLNPRLCEKTGYDEATLTGMKVWELDRAIDAEQARTLWEGMDAGDTHRLEGEYERADGSTFPVEVHIRRFELEASPRFLAISRDITARKRRQQELRRNERRFEAMLDDPHILVGVLDPDGTIRHINETAMGYIDADLDDVLGRDIWTTPWWTEELPPVVKEKVEQAAGGEYVTYEADLTYPSGEPYSVVGVIRPVRDADGKTVSLVISARDITERKKREQQLDAMDRVLRHNLHNEMSIILGAAETITEQAGGDVADLAEMIRTSSEQLLALTSKQRDIVELVIEDPGVTSVDVTRLVHHAVERVSEAHQAAEVVLSAPSGVRARGVPQLDQAVAELVENAIVHADDASPSVEVEAETAGERVRISVADTGPRIPPPERAILRGEGEGGPLYHGSGMGLWLVNWIVSSCDGRVTYEERSPTGNLVTIELPVSESDVEERTSQSTD
jgi:PAS domain S-box-containing protein